MISNENPVPDLLYWFIYCIKNNDLFIPSKCVSLFLKSNTHDPCNISSFENNWSKWIRNHKYRIFSTEKNVLL